MKYLFIFLVSALHISATLYAQKQNKSVYISGNANVGDTIVVEFADHYTGTSRIPAFKRKTAEQICSDNSFGIRVNNIIGPSYFTVLRKLNHKPYRGEYLLQPGDSVHIEIDQTGKPIFSGRGAEAMTCRYSMDSAHIAASTYKASIYPNQLLAKGESVLYLEAEMPRIDSGFTAARQILENRKKQLPLKMYQIFQADLLGGYANAKYSAYRAAKDFLPKRISVDSMNKIIKVLNNFFDKQVVIPQTSLPDSILTYSTSYINSVVNIIALKSMIDNKYGYQSIIDKYKGQLRDQLLSIYLLAKKSTVKSIDSVMRSCLKIIKTDYWRNAIDFALANSTKGAMAYNFRLEDMEGRMRSLSDFKGKRVVIDYWFVGCTSCTYLYTTTYKDVERSFKSDTTIVFISVSEETDRKLWLDNVRKNIYTSPETINLKVSDLGNQDPFVKKYGLDGAPTLIIIDENGRIFYNGNAPRNEIDLKSLINSK